MTQSPANYYPRHEPTIELCRTVGGGEKSPSSDIPGYLKWLSGSGKNEHALEFLVGHLGRWEHYLLRILDFFFFFILKRNEKHGHSTCVYTGAG